MMLKYGTQSLVGSYKYTQGVWRASYITRLVILPPFIWHVNSHSYIARNIENVKSCIAALEAVKYIYRY